MNQLIFQKIPFVVELIFNGSFIVLYLLKSKKNLGLLDHSIFGNIISFGAYAVPLILIIHLVANFIQTKGIEDFFRKYVFSIIIIIPLFITWGDMEFAFWLSSAHLFSSIMAVYDSEPEHIEKIGKRNRVANFWSSLKMSSSQIVTISFIGTILLGAFLLILPVSPADGKTVSFVDALFMATSATCVTGLATVSVANDFSIFGQLVLLMLIQVGGLGFMTLTSSMTIFLGKSMRMKDRMVMQDLLDVSSQEELIAMILDIIKYTFFIELWGGIILTIAFTFEGFELGTALYYGFFHSISAFCNAGLALFDTSLESYSVSPMIHGTIAVLITLGGIGFITLRELREVVTFKRKIDQFTLHSKVVLLTSFVLTVGGAVFIFFGEFLDSIDGYSLWQKTQVALFQSVTLRTAGFNTVPISQFNSYTIYGMCLIMFIGASPGSTGGGIKTTTFAILVQSIITTLRGQKTVVMMGRTISAAYVVRTIALTFMSIIIVSVFILIMMKVESQQAFLTLVFEVISAFATVGLSLGVTPYLSATGKLVIALLMLIGRIGPITMLLAIGEKSGQKGNYEYPDGRIMIG
jgi:trk system potassium uptake protein TrkH